MILSRWLIAVFVLRTPFADLPPSFSSPALWNVLKIAILQDSSGDALTRFLERLSEQLEQKNPEGLFQVILRDLTESFVLLQQGEYSESVRRKRREE